MGRIAVIGSFGVGMTMAVARVPNAGETVLAGKFAMGPGGKGSNQAIGARRLGADVDFLTAVGPDDFGQNAHALWAREGVHAEYVKTGSRSTMVGVILVEPSGENRIIVDPGALEELDQSDVEAFAPVIAAADLCVTSLEIPVAAAVAALRVARLAKTPTLLNPAPAAPLPDDAWPLIDYLTPNRNEAEILTHADSATEPTELVSLLRARFMGTIALTLGADGVLLDTRREQAYVPAVPTRHVVDTTGAGDAFTAAFAVAITEGLPPLEAVRFASAAGAHAVSIAEVIPSLPYRRDLRTYLNRR